MKAANENNAIPNLVDLENIETEVRDALSPTDTAILASYADKVEKGTVVMEGTFRERDTYAAL